MGLDLDALAAWVQASCQRQGVPVFVSDPGVLTRVKALVGVGMPVRGGSAAGRSRAQAPGPYSTHTG